MALNSPPRGTFISAEFVMTLKPSGESAYQTGKGIQVQMTMRDRVRRYLKKLASAR